MIFGTLILDYAWHQAAMFFVTAAATAGAAIMLSRWSVISPWRLLGAAIVSVAFAWAGVDALTSSTRIDARGITVEAPLDLVQRHASLSWDDIIGAEIVPARGWLPRQRLRVVSRTGSDIVIPISAVASEDVALLADHIAAQPAARMLPDARTFFGQVELFAPGLGGRKMRTHVSYEHVALHWFQPNAF
jgi:hypothetical protein